MIEYTPTGRPSDAVFSICAAPGWITLCILLNGTKLKDPHKLLRGSGTRVRNIRLEGGTSDIKRPEVIAPMDQALEVAGFPYDPKVKGKLVIQSISPKQHPRRKATQR